MLLLLSMSLTYSSVNGNECLPCRCETETINCAGVESIPLELLYMIGSFDRIIIPSHLIDHKILQLSIVLEPTDTRECTFICTIPNVRSTCLCQVS